MYKYSSLFCLIFLCVNASFVFAYFPSPNDWRDQTFYEIMVDRFENGDSTNDNYDANYYPSNWGEPHGGDLKGITEHLSYIKQMGITALWITPVPTNDGDYHQYAAVNFEQVDPRLGSMADLQNLIQQAHALGMYVFLDIVCNHTGERIQQSSSTWSYPTGCTLSWIDPNNTYAQSPMNSLSEYHNYGDISDFNDTTQVQLGWLEGLNDLKTEDSTVQNELISIYEWWIQQTDCDGFRIDTFEEVNIGFWQAFCPTIRSYAASLGKNNFFMYGEDYNSSDASVGYYTGMESGSTYVMPSMLYYPMFFTISDVFADGQATKEIDDEYGNLTSYDTTTWSYLATFIDNHDNPRFMSPSVANNDTSKLELALTFLLTSRGVPIVYYGTEQGFYGEDDPYCREDMFAGLCKDTAFIGQNSFNPTSTLYEFTSTLLYLRNTYIPLRRGTFTSRWNNSTTAGIYAYSRIYNGEEIIVILNTATSVQTTQNGGTGMNTSFAQGTVLTNLLDTLETTTVGANGVGSTRISVVMPPKSVAIYSSYVVATAIPIVASNYPVNTQTSVALNQTISVGFNLSMNQTSVQSAFSTNPVTSGTFSWNGPTLTYTPSTTLQGSQTYTVTIASTAYDLNSISLGTSYSFSFTTLPANDSTPPVITNITPTNGTTIENTYLPTIQATLSDTGSGINPNTIVMTLDNSTVVPTYSITSGLLSYTPTIDLLMGQSGVSLSTGLHQVVISAQDSCGNSVETTDQFNIALSKVMDGNFSSGEWSTTELRVTNNAEPWGSENYIKQLYVSADSLYLYVGVVGTVDLTTASSDDNVIGVYVDVPTITTGTSEVDYFSGMTASGWDPDFMYAVVRLQNDPNSYRGGGSVRRIYSDGSTVEIGNMSTGDCGALSGTYNSNGIGGIEFRIPWSATNGATENSTVKVGAWLAWANDASSPIAGLGGGSGDQLGAQIGSNDLTIKNPWVGVPNPSVPVELSDFSSQ